MFIILINDMGTVLKQCEHILYADDTVLYTSGKLCEKIERELNDDLASIANWLGENNLIVNLKKTKTECILFGTHQKTSKAKSMEIKMNGVDVTESTFYEYLGAHGQKPYSYWPLEQGCQKGLVENKFVESYTSQCKSIHGKNHLQSYDFAGYALLW